MSSNKRKAQPKFELTILPDKGCPDLGIESCFTCPLPRCRYDLKGEELSRAVLELRKRNVA